MRGGPSSREAPPADVPPLPGCSGDVVHSQEISLRRVLSKVIDSPEFQVRRRDALGWRGSGVQGVTLGCGLACPH